MRVSALDVSPIAPGRTRGDALRESVAIAVVADEIGMERVWFAEHHGVAGLASTSPAIPIVQSASVTERIRLGAGGVMLGHYPPPIVHEQFLSMNSLWPGRIDLGVGRALGADRIAAARLRSWRSSYEDFPSRLDCLLDRAGGLSADFRLQFVAEEGRVSLPPVYVLCSSEETAFIAAERGLKLAVAHHLSPDRSGTSVNTYREHFSPADSDSRPYVIVSLGVVCAASQGESEQRAVRAMTMRLRMLRSSPGVQVSWAELCDPDLGDMAADILRALRSSGLAIGRPEVVAEAVTELASSLNADEVMLCPLELDRAGRERTLRLVVSALDLD